MQFRTKIDTCDYNTIRVLLESVTVSEHHPRISAKLLARQDIPI